MPKPCETAARKLPKRCFWNLLKTKKKSRLKQGKPLRNVRLGSLQATRPNSRKRCLGRACEKAEPHQVLCPSHCETVAGKMPKRRCWNPLKRERNRAQTMRNRSQKTAETLLLDPTKNKEKTCKPPGQTQEGVWDAHAKRQNPSRFCAQAIAKPQPKKCRNVAVGTHYMRNRSQKTAETLLLEPTKNAEKRKMPKRCFWNLLKTKKGCLKQGKPLRNVRLGSLQATRPNSRKRCLGRACEKAEPQQVLCPSHCETAAGKMPKRRFWNPFKKFKKKEIVPKPCETAH